MGNGYARRCVWPRMHNAVSKQTRTNLPPPLDERSAHQSMPVPAHAASICQHIAHTSSSSKLKLLCLSEQALRVDVMIKRCSLGRATAQKPLHEHVLKGSRSSLCALSPVTPCPSAAAAADGTSQNFEGFMDTRTPRLHDCEITWMPVPPSNGSGSRFFARQSEDDMVQKLLAGELPERICRPQAAPAAAPPSAPAAGSSARCRTLPAHRRAAGLMCNSVDSIAACRAAFRS